MTYSRPAGMKYTDMCIYIDANIENVAKSDHPDNKVVENIYKYLYLIVYALACKQRYFRDEADYENFALSTASILYMRLADKRQYLPDDDPKKIKPIKSVLNYINAAMYGLKVNYQQENFFPALHPDIIESGNIGSLSDLEYLGEDQNMYAMKDAVIEEFEFLPNKINRVLKTTPYRNDPVLYKNLYISLMLSFVDAITIKQSKKKKRNKSPELDVNKEKQLDESIFQTYLKQQENKPILYKVPAELSDYVKVLLNRVKKDFGSILIDTKQSYRFSDETLTNIVTSIYAENHMGGNNYDD